VRVRVKKEGMRMREERVGREKSELGMRRKVVRGTRPVGGRRCGLGMERRRGSDLRLRMFASGLRYVRGWVIT